MNNIGSRIFAKRKALKLTQKELGKLVGVSSTAIVYWERGETEPKNRNLASLARALDCAPDYILHGANFGDELTMTQIHSRVPLILWDHLSSFDGNAMDDLNSETWLYCPVQCGANTFAVKIIGDAMMSSSGGKSYPDGTVIFVDPDVSKTIGSNVVAKLPLTHQATFREYTLESGEVYLVPINKHYPITHVGNDVLIIGVVIGSFHPE
tara:strand:- start:247 stop:873 length:627 start_codon:yes stop_codon:yes gene_type:complete